MVGILLTMQSDILHLSYQISEIMTYNNTVKLRWLEVQGTSHICSSHRGVRAIEHRVLRGHGYLNIPHVVMRDTFVTRSWCNGVRERCKIEIKVHDKNIKK